MKILIIGGTKFLGRHLIDAARRNGHEITLFNRGRFSDEVLANIEQIHGDRNFDLDVLKNRRFDAVIDTCGYLPPTVKLSAEALQNSVGQYVFISSISAYADFSQPNFDETAETAKLNAAQLAEIEKIDLNGDITAATLGANYGAAKALCEREVEKAFPNRDLIVRSGLIVGAFDSTDRFTYWVMRTAKGGKIFAPGSPERFVQLIDGRDLAEWIIESVENKLTGIFNVTGKPFETTFGAMLEEIKNITESDAEFVWVDDDFMKRENVQPWSEMPLYLPESDEETKGFLSANIDKARSKGLKFRRLSDTIREILNWRETRTDELKAGISAEREIELLGKHAIFLNSENLG